MFPVAGRRLCPPVTFAVEQVATAQYHASDGEKVAQRVVVATHLAGHLEPFEDSFHCHRADLMVPSADIARNCINAQFAMVIHEQDRPAQVLVNHPPCRRDESGQRASTTTLGFDMTGDGGTSYPHQPTWHGGTAALRHICAHLASRRGPRTPPLLSAQNQSQVGDRVHYI